MYNKVNVKAGGNKIRINATSDLSNFYSELSKKWAVSDVIVEGTDYSSKYYANVSKNSAAEAKQSVSQAETKVNEGIEDINAIIKNATEKLDGTNFPIFCFNSGPVDANGEPALLTLENGVITQHSPAVCTTADGITYSVSEDIKLDISSLEAGKYNIFYNPETKKLEVYSNKIFIQKSKPDNWAVNDIWLDESVMPRKLFMKKSDTEFLECKLVQNAVITVISGGGGSMINRCYNDTGGVHINSDETVNGVKIFANDLPYGSSDKTVFKNAGFANITLQSTEIHDGVKPSANKFAGIDFRDKNNARIGFLGIGVLADGRQYIDLQEQGSTSGFKFPKCTTKPSATSTASNNNVAVVTENYVNGDSWYWKRSDGLIVQGGYVSSNAETFKQITFLKTFSTTPLFANYSISAKNSVADTQACGESTICDNITATGMNIATRGADAKIHTRRGCWIAIGY